MDMGVSLEQSPFISFSSFVYGESASLFLVLWDLLFLKLYKIIVNSTLDLLHNKLQVQVQCFESLTVFQFG